MDDLPDTHLEQAHMLQNILIERATGGLGDNRAYTMLRRELISETVIKPLLPKFIRTCRDLNHFWGYIKGADPHYLGDAHGQGRTGYKVAPRHASLVVNLAGSMSIFLIETYQAITAFSITLHNHDKMPQC